MLTKEKLKRTYIRYTPDITEEMFNRIIARFIECGFKAIGSYSNFKGFKEFGAIKIYIDGDYQTASKNESFSGTKQIFISDILGEDETIKLVEKEEWWKDLKKGDYVVRTDGNDSIIPFNYIFKTNHGNIKTYGLITDLNGNANGYQGSNEKSFRPATPEEIKMYEHAGKPVDVTTYKIPASTELKLEDLVEGEIYYKKAYNTEWVFDYVSNSPYKCDNTFVNSNSRFGNKNGHIQDYNNSPDRPATPEEKQWLNICIAENKFIEKDYALRGYDMYGKALKSEVIPEAVESKSEEKSMKAIIIENKEQWNFALNRIRKGKNFYEKPNSYATECMSSISGEFADIKYYKARGDEVITFDQWCKEENIDNPFTKKMKDEFVVGKWYKSDNKSYICKLEEVKGGNEIWSTKWISNKVYSKEKNKTWMTASIVDEAPLSEIQQYLPDGHIDKVMKEEFKVGDWVYLSVVPKSGNSLNRDKSEDGIYQLLEIDESKHPTGHLKEESHFMFKKGMGYYRTNKINAIRKATPEEIYKAGGYPKQKETKYFDDLSQHIGRYIKALVDYPDGGDVRKGEIGKILDKEYADFPSQSYYACNLALAEFNKGRYELLPEDYSPEVKSDNMEDLLEEAKKRYPVGCAYIAVDEYGKPTDGIFEVKDETYIPYKYGSKSIALKGACGLVYTNGKWAEIISSPKESVKEEKTTNHQFKVGDEVFLPEYGLGMFNDGSKESKDWALTDGIPLNTKLIVRNVSVNGNICFLGYEYSHPASKFKPILELNKQVVYDPEEWGWKVTNAPRPYDWAIHSKYSTGIDSSKGADMWKVPTLADYPLTPDEVVKQDVISPILFNVKKI